MWQQLQVPPSCPKLLHGLQPTPSRGFDTDLQLENVTAPYTAVPNLHVPDLCHPAHAPTRGHTPSTLWVGLAGLGPLGWLGLGSGMNYPHHHAPSCICRAGCSTAAHPAAPIPHSAGSP